MKDARKILKNIASLGLMQLVNYVLPIIMMPFLVINIGISNVGLIATFTAIATYMQLVIDYGFNLSATRDIAKNGYDNSHASIITSSVFAIKILFSSVFFLLSLSAFEFIPNLEEFRLPFLLTLGIVIFQSLFPVWHFQAAEKMHFITFCNTIPKILAACMVFLFVRSHEDVWLVQACFLSGAIISFVASLIVLLIIFNFKFKISFYNFYEQIKNGYAIFLARFASGLYKNFNVLILGLLAGTASVGAYSIAERILRSAQMVQNVLGDALYPSFSKGSFGNKSFFRRAAKKYQWHVIIFYSISSLALFYLSDYIAHFIGRTAAQEVSSCLKIMSAAFFFGGLNYVCAILGLTSCGYAKEFSISVIATGLFNILCATLLTYFYTYYGTSLAVVLSEMFLLCCVVVFSKRCGVL